MKHCKLCNHDWNLHEHIEGLKWHCHGESFECYCERGSQDDW